MKILLQRVNHASVRVADQIVGQIEEGVLLFIAFGQFDEVPESSKAIQKILNMRIFSDENGRLADSLIDIQGEILVVPQFTLYASTHKGRRPDFTGCQEPKMASLHFDQFVESLRQACPLKVQTGQFGADMNVSIENDGPFTLELEY